MDKIYSDFSIHNCPYTYKNPYWKKDFTFYLVLLNPYAVSSILLFPFSLSDPESESLSLPSRHFQWDLSAQHASLILTLNELDRIGES